MGECNPIFGTGSTQIGYVEGDEAFDLSGRKRCNYSKETGNLFNDGRKTVGHVSLSGKFVGASWIADELFPKFDNAQTGRRGKGGMPSQPLSESDGLTANSNSPEEFSAPDPTEAFQSKMENEESAADAERRVISGTPNQLVSELSQATTLTELVEQSSAPDPTEAIQFKDENEQRAVDAKPSSVSETPSQPLSEASQVTTLTESAPSADPSEAIQFKDENERRTADAKRRGISGAPSQPLSEASQATTLTEPAEEPSAADPTEDIQLADAEPRGVSGTPSQPLSEASETTTLIDSPEEPSTPGPTEALHSKDADKDRLVEILKAFKRAADAKRRGIGGTPSQPLSAPTKVRAPMESPEEPSATDSAEAFNSNDADKDRVVEVLKALMKRSQGR